MLMSSLELLIGDLEGIDVCRTIVHEVIQHDCLQRLQPEIKEGLRQSHTYIMGLQEEDCSNTN